MAHRYPRDQNTMMAKIGICFCCKAKPISSEAEECPHCGQPNPYHSSEQDVFEEGSIHEGEVTKLWINDDKDCGTLFIEFPQGQKGELSLYPQNKDPLVKKRCGDPITVKIASYSGYGFGRYECWRV